MLSHVLHLPLLIITSFQILLGCSVSRGDGQVQPRTGREVRIRCAVSVFVEPGLLATVGVFDSLGDCEVPFSHSGCAARLSAVTGHSSVGFCRLSIHRPRPPDTVELRHSKIMYRLSGNTDSWATGLGSEGLDER